MGCAAKIEKSACQKKNRDSCPASRGGSVCARSERRRATRRNRPFHRLFGRSPHGLWKAVEKLAVSTKWRASLWTFVKAPDLIMRVSGEGSSEPGHRHANARSRGRARDEVKNPGEAGAPARERCRVLRQRDSEAHAASLTRGAESAGEEGSGSRSHGGGRESLKGANVTRVAAVARASKTHPAARLPGGSKPLEPTLRSRPSRDGGAGKTRGTPSAKAERAGLAEERQERKGLERGAALREDRDPEDDESHGRYRGETNPGGLGGWKPARA